MSDATEDDEPSEPSVRPGDDQAHGATERRPLEATLWGKPRFTHLGAEFELTSHKGIAMLAFLVAVARPVRREELAVLLWGRGRLANVRQALYTLRSLPGADAWLHDDQVQVSVAARSDLQRLKEAEGKELARFAEALDGTELLEGLDAGLPDEYLEWLNRERDVAARLAIAAYRARAAELAGEAEPARARELIERAQQLDVYDEELQAVAMQLDYRRGEPAAALTGYERFRSRLKSELDTEPGAELIELAERIRDRRPLVESAALTDAELRTLHALSVAAGALRVDGLARVLKRDAFELTAELATLAERGLIDERLIPVAARLQAAGVTANAPLERLLRERVVAELQALPTTAPGSLVTHLLQLGRRSEAAEDALAGGVEAFHRGEFAAASELLFRAVWAGHAEPELRLRALLQLEEIAAQHADLAGQGEFLAEAERIAWELQSDADLAEVNIRRTRLLLARAKVGEALEAALTALETALRIGSESLIARARNAAGAAQFYAGDLDGAAAAFSVTVTSAVEVERYRAHNNLGSINAIRGRLEESYHHFDEALTLARRNSHLLDVSATLNNVAASAERFGDYARAERHFREAIQLARRRGAGGREAEMLVNLAIVYGRQGQLGPSWNTTVEVEELAAELEDVRLSARAAEQRAEIMRLCGELDGALETVATALALASELGDERRRRAIEAQRLVLSTRVQPDTYERAEEAVAELEAARIFDVSPWLRLELASWTHDPEFGARQLATLGPQDLKSAHQRIVKDIAWMRLSLLDGADASVEAEGAAAYDRLTRLGFLRATASSAAAALGATSGRSVAALQQIVERPKARYLAALVGGRLTQPGTGEPRGVARGGAPAHGALGSAEDPVGVVAELREQGKGLPRPLAESLLRTPALWLPG